MRCLIGYDSALEYWRSSTARGNASPNELRSATLKAQRSLTQLSSGIKHGNIAAPVWCNDPIHILAPKPCRIRTKRIHTHSIVKLPSSSCIEVDNRYLISTPEFCFLQYANKLNLIGLIQLGYELCGTYALCDNAYEDGFIKRNTPLTNASRLLSFARRADGQSGRCLAVRAAKYVSDNSASPRETVLAMLLSLPYSLGGYGMEKPEMNYEIEIPEALRDSTGKRRFFCDLYWPKHKLCVEYDSDEFHVGADRIASDSLRRNLLSDMGIDVITVTNRQISSKIAFDAAAKQICRKAKKRLRMNEREFCMAQRALRNKLLGL